MQERKATEIREALKTSFNSSAKSLQKPTRELEDTMPKRKICNSELDESESEEKLSEEEDEVIHRQEQRGISEYEKQRLSRIAENRARMEALGLSKMASSLMGSSRNSSRTSSKLKGKRKVVDDDEDYRPNDEDDHDDDDDNDDKLDDDDERLPGNKKPQSQSQSRKNEVKNKGSKPRKKALVEKHLSRSDYIDDDDDDELMKAIALSLQDSGEVSAAVHTDMQDANFTERKGNARLKKKKSFTSRVQMTEDEMVVHFFQFDGAGKGSISMRDLRRVAIAHDFMWTDKDLSEMIRCFDSDGDGKLNLDDFRKIVTRCNMLRTSETS